MERNSTDNTRERGRGPSLLDAGLAHVDEWGSVWFGAIFWGSILVAAGRELVPNAAVLLVAAISAAIGAGAGLVARRRGYWL
ncbi:MAG: hypothetical protein AAGC53_09190 [Actinomycetota bacterium]